MVLIMTELLTSFALGLCKKTTTACLRHFKGTLCVNLRSNTFSIVVKLPESPRIIDSPPHFIKTPKIAVFIPI